MFGRITHIWQNLLVTVILVLSATTSFAQNTAFTYQGKLADGGTAATGNYDFEFKLFDTAAVGTGSQKGTTLQRLNVAVASGIFTVSLDFGACASCFDGAVRFLEIAVKPTSGSTFITLGPRQSIATNPYAIRSLNSVVADGLSVACVNCVTSSQIQSVNGSQITGAIPVASVPTGSANYIQNGTSPQATSNFNISGTGKASILDATSQYNIDGSRVLSNAGSNNLFAGINAGTANTIGNNNAFFGAQAGQANTSGVENSFFGFEAGKSNTTAIANTFFGASAGKSTISGAANSFFGASAGRSTTAGFNSFFGQAAGYENTTGSANSFFGSNAGQNNTTGISNSFFGAEAGFNLNINSTTGGNNSFFGRKAGRNNTAGSNNTFVGFSSGLSNTNEDSNTFIGANANGAAGITNATALGANAVVTESDTMVLGTNTVSVQVPGSLNIAGSFGANILNATTQFNLNGNRVFQVTGSVSFPNSNVFLGLGAGEVNVPNGSNGVRNTFVGNNAGAGNTTGFANSFFGALAGEANISGAQNSFFGRAAGQLHQTGSDNAFFGSQAGQSTITGSRNTYIGSAAGGSDALTNANAFGYRAFATQSNSLILGSINGVNAATADTNVGIGTTAPTSRLHVVGDALVTGNLAVNGTLNANLSSNIVNATTQYNLGGNRVFQVTGGGSFLNGNTFVGFGAGVSTVPSATTGEGNLNSFFGAFAGRVNTTGFNNTFFGNNTGEFNTAGSRNSFFGPITGRNNTTGNDNTFFGLLAGDTNTSGSSNTIIGASANVGANNLTNATALGANAQVTQSNSLVLGSINGVNGATTDTNVGIGTTVPSARLEVAGNTLLYPTVGSGTLSIRNRTNTNYSQVVFLDNLGTYRGYMGYIGANAGLGPRNDTVEVGSNGKDITFRPNESEVMRLTAANVGIGTTSPEAPLHIQRNGNLNDWQNAQLRISGVSDTRMQLNLGYDTTNNRGVIQAGQHQVAYKDLLLNPFGGNIGIGVSAPTFQLQLSTDSAAKPNGGSWSNPSDRRLKENIRPVTDGLAVLRQINPVSYLLNGKAGMPKGEPGIGIIAQDVRDLLPYTISTFKARLEAGDAAPTELLTFNSSAVTFVLINAVKELSARLDALHSSGPPAEVAALKQENETQKQRIAVLDARLAAMEQLLKKLIEKP